MREHPEVSYRSFARVLGVSHATISRWAAEAGLPPRETNAERKLRRERARAGRRRRLWQPRPAPQDTDEEELDDPDERDEEVAVVEELEDDRDFDDDEDEEVEDDEGDAPSPTPYLAQAIEAWANSRTTRTGRTQPSRRSSQLEREIEQRPTKPAPAPASGADPRTRLGAITAELDGRRPRGRVAVNLLVKAAPYLLGGVAALRSYGEARGCDPEDIATAERMIAGWHVGRIS